MMTPEDLYNSYSKSPCESLFATDPLRGDLFGKTAKGTPLYMKRVVQFLKHVKYPCINNVPKYNEINNTGSNKLGLNFKFLQKLDIECFTEIQPSIRSGTSHAIRNASDITRACFLTASGNQNQWHHRSSPEYLEHFGENSLPDCLMALGPDLVPDTVAQIGRAPSTNLAIPSTYAGMSCLPGDGVGMAGTFRSCMVPPNATIPVCRSCEFCPIEPPQPDHPCCHPGTIRYINECCGAPLTSRTDFSYLSSQIIDNSNILLKPSKTFHLFDVDSLDVLTEDKLVPNSILYSEERGTKIRDILYSLVYGQALYFRNNTIWIYIGGFPFLNSSYVQYDFRLRHVGILERKIYGGYANLLDNAGPNFNGILDDIFLDYFQGINDWNYTDNNIKNPLPASIIPRMRTISLLLDATISQGRSPVTNSQNMVNSIKDLLWNGYGILLFSNIGFPNIRDSQGLSYPDRIWYTTYTVIGYDDTKLEFDECVYVLSCPWGNWITGGHPSWGPLPPGCFLVTETHLKCMLNYYPDGEFYGCRSQLPCNPALKDCDDPAIITQLSGCGSHGPSDKCEPYYCSKQQRSTGLVFALSMTDNFGPQALKHQDFYPISKIKKLVEEKTLYYQNR
jgi:hypothetical protein